MTNCTFGRNVAHFSGAEPRLWPPCHTSFTRGLKPGNFIKMIVKRNCTYINYFFIYLPTSTEKHLV